MTESLLIDRPPYVYLLCNIRAHSLMYFFRMDESKMDALVAAWTNARGTAAVLTFDTGAEGTWHIPADDILFFKRITEADADEMRANANRARLAAAGLSGIR